MTYAKRSWNPLALVLILSGVFFAIFLAVSGAFYLYKGQGRSSSHKTFTVGGESIGVIELNGVIMDSKRTLAKLQSFEDDDEIKGIVLRLNSPGGAVAPSQEIYEKVKDYKKPLVVSMSSVAASGAFYVACGAKKVFANPGTITGSIGVIMEFVNLKKLYDWAKVERYSIKTGKYKDQGAEYRDMPPDERALLQGMVDDVLSQFKKAVATGRKMTPDQVTAIADGRVFSGSQAKSLKLVDELGTLQDAVNDVAKQAGIKGQPNVIYPSSPKPRWMEMLFDQKGDDDESETHLSGLQGVLGNVLGGVHQSLTQSITGLAPGVYWLWSAAR